MLFRLIRALCGKGGPGILRQRAVNIAQDACAIKGWPWKDPVQVSERLFDWYIYTNSSSRGGNVAFTIDRKTGEIMRSDFIKW